MGGRMRLQCLLRRTDSKPHSNLRVRCFPTHETMLQPRIDESKISIKINCSGGSRIFQMVRQPQMGAPTYYFSGKVHENERNQTDRGTHVPRAPLDPPMNCYFWLIETDLIHRVKLNVFTDWKFVRKFAQKFYFMQIRNKDRGNLRGEFNKSISPTSYFYT